MGGAQSGWCDAVRVRTSTEGMKCVQAAAHLWSRLAAFALVRLLRSVFAKFSKSTHRQSETTSVSREEVRLLRSVFAKFSKSTHRQSETTTVSREKVRERTLLIPNPYRLLIRCPRHLRCPHHSTYVRNIYYTTPATYLCISRGHNFGACR